MTHYLKLNLPRNPLRFSAEQESQRQITGGYNLVRPEEILSDEILGLFEQMKLTPKYVTLFGRNDIHSSLKDRLIHTDLTMNADGTWRKCLFGINWELEGATNLFQWYDMTAVKEAWPNEQLSEHSKYKLLNGIHYVTRGGMGVPDGAVKLEETYIDGPTLVRTDVGHLTLYTSKIYKRLGISVRFDETPFQSWQDVYQHMEAYRQ
jgi:hypothetical protein